MSKLTKEEWEQYEEMFSGASKQYEQNQLLCKLWSKIKDDLKPEEKEWEPKEKLWNVELGTNYRTVYPLSDDERFAKMRFYWNLEQLKQELNGDWDGESESNMFWMSWDYQDKEWCYLKTYFGQRGFGPFRDLEAAEEACDRMNRSSWAKGVF